MINLNEGKTSVLAISTTLVVGTILLGNLFTSSVLATKPSSTPTATPSATPLSCNPGYHNENGQCVHNGNGNGNCGQNQGNGNNGQDNGYGNGNSCGTATPTATPTATATPIATSTPTATPTATPDPTATPFTAPTCTGDTHLDASGRNCVSFQYGGPQVQSANSTPQVLGASTMAGTGSFTETFYQAIMGLGGIFTVKGIKKIKKASKKA